MNTNTPSSTPPGGDTPAGEVINLGDILGTGSTYPLAASVPTPANTPPASTPPATPPSEPTNPVNVVTPDTPSVGNTVVTEPTYLDIVKDFTNSKASGEIKDLYNELITTFKATSVDPKGNLLDANNKIIVTADKVEEYLLTDTLPLNEEGALVDSEGNVLRTAEELNRSSSTILSVKGALESNLDIQFEEGADFPDTIEGIVELVSNGIKQKEKVILTSFLESNPEVKQFVNHLALGGTPDTYTASNIDYKSIDVKGLDNQTKLNLVAQSLKEQGNVNPGAFVDLLNKAGEEAVNSAAFDALKYLDAKQTETNAKRDADVKALQAKEKQDTINYWKNVETTINQGKIANLNIPIKERQAFFEFMSKPIDENYNSAESIKAQEESLDFQLLVSYLRFKDGDLSKLATNIAREERVRTLTERLNKGRTDRNGVPRTISSTGRDAGGPPSLNDILGNS